MMTPIGGNPPPTVFPVFASYCANLFFGALHWGHTYASGCRRKKRTKLLNKSSPTKKISMTDQRDHKALMYIEELSAIDRR
jgi:hypothetical protein